ncbi:hypothetical protein [Actinokineospora sp. NBRC 105648]|uniref:hypothetical protein n=1 Tax=Actinokineospora sp. NBRC 105648 TaxID=3032206 RepID=UPI0025544FA9|nr:hypothetical protein [Actinokineospora sp. NBRC 105648]
MTALLRHVVDDGACTRRAIALIISTAFAVAGLVAVLGLVPVTVLVPPSLSALLLRRGRTPERV